MFVWQEFPVQDVVFVKCEANEEPTNTECDEDESDDSSMPDHYLAHFSCETVLEEEDYDDQVTK